MGSLTSRPKSVAARSVIPANIPSTESSPAPPPVTTPDPQEAAKQRIENVLRRSRSALGNILTSFRGVLASGNIAPTRKNLLGE